MGDSYRPGGGGGGRRRGDANDNYRKSGFSFRGAAGDNYRPRQSHEDFTFRAPQQAPHFPQEQPRDRPQRQPRDRQGRRNGAPFKSKANGGPPFRRGKRAAHERDLIKRATRDSTPEQLAGMNADKSQKYAEYISDSSDDESDSESDSSSRSDSGQADGSSRKRVKTSQDADVAVPKWSNPDPYSVLPPTDMGIGPKKDIVQVIRKSKLEASAPDASTNAVKENVDFISFDFGDDGENDSDESDGGIALDDGFGPPPAPPTGLVMPSDNELMDTYARDFKGSKRKRDFASSDLPRDVVYEWQPIPGANPTPWRSDDAEFTSHIGLQ